MAVAPDTPSDALAWVSTWLGSILNDVIRVLSDPEGQGALLDGLGWSGGTPEMPSGLLERLDEEAQAGTDPTAKSVETLGEVLVALGTLVDALVAASEAADPMVEVTEIVADALDLAITFRLRETHPVAWATLRMLNLLYDDVFALATVSSLFTDPTAFLATLTGPAGGVPATSEPGYMQEYTALSFILAALGGVALFLLKPIPSGGDWLDPHSHDADAFRNEVFYGWAPAGPDDHPNLVSLLARTLTWRLDFQKASSPDLTAGAEQVFDLTCILVPPEHNEGHAGVFLRLAGASTIEVPLGTPSAPDTSSSSGTSPAPATPPPSGTPDPTTTPPKPTGWQFTLTSTDVAAVEILIADNGFVRGSQGDFQLGVAVERPADVSGSWVIGSPKGSHVEIQHARVSGTVAEATVRSASDEPQQTLLLDLGAHSDHIIVNIELGSDSFLADVLPPAIRLDSKLGLGVELGPGGRGLYLDGGIALVADLPVDIEVGSTGVFALAIEGLHLRIGLTGPDPSGDGKYGASFALALTMDAAVTVGSTLTATIAGVGFQYLLKQVLAQPATSSTDGTQQPATFGHWQPSLDAVSPTGIGLVIRAGGVVAGGGFINHDPSRHEYAGALQLQLDVGPLSATKLTLQALALLDTEVPGSDGWALMLLVSAIFEPGIPIGSGFELDGFGGLVAYNHSLDSDAIAAGLRTRALDAILFPPNPVAQAPHIFAVWRQTLPVADGHGVIGMFGRIAGASGLIVIEFGLLIEFAWEPVQIVIVGSFQLSAPNQAHPLIRLRADLIGRLRFSPLDFMLEAELVDSKIGGSPVSGGLVIMARGGDDSAYLISAGGFNPHFTPPGNVPVPDRLRLDLTNTPNPRLRLEAYQAITSQTYQFGARAQLHASAGPLAVDGWLGYDVLIAWLPHFRFSAEIAAGLSLSFDSSPVLEVSIDVLLEGPGPWHIHGYVSLSLLFVTLPLPIEHTWGDDAGPTAPVADPLQLVRDALSAPDAWSAPPPAASSAVTLRTPGGGAIPAHPLGSVACRQRIVPLGLQVTHVGTQPLAAPMTVDVTNVSLAGTTPADVSTVTESFAAGQFLDLSDDEELSRPSFEPMRAGVAVGATTVDAGNATVVATTYKTVTVDGGTRTTRPPRPLDLAHAVAVLSPPPPGAPRPVPLAFTLNYDTLRTLAGGTAPPETASLAAQRGGGRLLDLAGVAGGTA